MNARALRTRLPGLPDFVHVLGVRWRRLDARRPWIRWTLIAALALWVGSDIARRNAAADNARLAWGDTSAVLVARRDLHAGSAIAEADFRVDQWPIAVRPPQAVVAIDSSLRLASPLAAGEALTTSRLLDTADRAVVIVPVALAADSFRVGQSVRLIDVGDPLTPPTKRVDVLAEGVVITAVGVDWVAAAVPFADAPNVAALAARAMVTVVAVGSIDAG